VVMSGQVVDQVPVRPVAPPPAPPAAPVAVAVPLTEAPVNGPVPIEVPAGAPIATPVPIATPSQVATPPPNPTGLFDRRRAPESPASSSELHALLDLPTTAPRREFEAAPDHVQVGASVAPVWKWRVDSEVRRDARSSWIKTAGLAVLGMSVVLLAGAIAFSAQGARATAPATASAATTAGQAPAQPAPTAPQAAMAPSRAAAAVPVVPAAAAADVTDTWVVQVGAFSSRDRSLSMVEELTEEGFPAFEVPTEARGGGLLYFVRVGPFKTASDADEARAKLRQFAELESAFVRSVTSVP
jgi:cell division septation protein DedD